MERFQSLPQATLARVAHARGSKITNKSNMRVALTLVSGNAKTGPIPVSTTSSVTCPDACPFKNGGGCYAESGPITIHWKKVTIGERGMDFDTFCNAIAELPNGQLWRHNQAGDLPGENNTLDTKALAKLVNANRGKRGFTYTHKPLATAEEREAIRNANANGFTVNLSGNDLTHADTLADMGIAPVVTVLPSTQTANTVTPKGRKVVVCPATQRDDVSCATCQMCQRQRDVIVGFPAHGTGAKRINIRLSNTN